MHRRVFTDGLTVYSKERNKRVVHPTWLAFTTRAHGSIHSGERKVIIAYLLLFSDSAQRWVKKDIFLEGRRENKGGLDGRNTRRTFVCVAWRNIFALWNGHLETFTQDGLGENTRPFLAFFHFMFDIWCFIIDCYIESLVGIDTHVSIICFDSNSEDKQVCGTEKACYGQHGQMLQIQSCYLVKRE